MRGFKYSTVAFVPDAVRTDRCNIAVIVVDAERSVVRYQKLRRLRGVVRSLSPATIPEAIDRIVDDLISTVTFQLPLAPQHEHDLARKLTSISESFVNQVQVSPPATFQGESIDEVLESLSAIHLAGALTRAPRYPGRADIRNQMERTIRSWDLGPYRLDTQRIRRSPANIPHQADMWIENGRLDAALYALGRDDEDVNAVTLRDSLPTVLNDFRTANPSFRVLAVTGVEESELQSETLHFLRSYEVDVTDVDNLGDFRSRLLPDMINA